MGRKMDADAMTGNRGILVGQVFGCSLLHIRSIGIGRVQWPSLDLVNDPGCDQGKIRWFCGMGHGIHLKKQVRNESILSRNDAKVAKAIVGWPLRNRKSSGFYNPRRGYAS
jgi:hypothetical protein